MHLQSAMDQQVPLLVGVGWLFAGVPWLSSMWPLNSTRLYQVGLVTLWQGSRRKWKQARSLETYAQNWHFIISATFYWPEHITQPAQSKNREIISTSRWKELQSHIVRGGIQGGVSN